MERYSLLYGTGIVRAACLMFLILCISCSGTSRENTHSLANTAVEPPPGLTLPGLAELDELAQRSASGAMNQQGASYFLKDDLASEPGGSVLDLNGDSEQASWAIHRFEFPAICKTTGASYTLSGEAEAGADLYFAIADYSTGRWRFAPANEAVMSFSDDYGTFSSPAGFAYLAVLAFKGKATLAAVALEDYPVPIIDGWLHSFDSSSGGNTATDGPVEFHMEDDGNLISIGRSNTAAPGTKFYNLILRHAQDGSLLDAKELRLQDETLTSPVIDRPYLAFGNNGDIYIAAGIDDELSGGDRGDILLVRMNSSFEIAWARRLVDVNVEKPNAIVVDGSGNLICIGRSSWDGTQPKPEPTEFGFIFKISADGNLLWNRKYTGSFRDERPLQLLCDKTDDTIHMRGLLDTGDGVFLASMSSAGTFNYSRYWSQTRSDSQGGFLLEDNGDLLLSASESADGNSFGAPGIDGKIIMRVEPDGTVAKAALLEVDNEFFFTTAGGSFSLDTAGGILTYVTTNNYINTIYKLSAVDLLHQSNCQTNVFGSSVIEADNGDLFCAGSVSLSTSCRSIVPLFTQLAISSTDITGQISFSDTSITLADYVSATLDDEARVKILNSEGTADNLNAAGGVDNLLIRYVKP